MSRSDNGTTKLVLDFIVQHQPCKVNQISAGTGLPCMAILTKLITIEKQGTLLTEDENGYIAIFEK